MYTVQVCRSAGYYEHALFVALAAGEPGAYLDTLLEDCHRRAQRGCAAHALPLRLRSLLLAGRRAPAALAARRSCDGSHAALPFFAFCSSRYSEGLEYIKSLPRREGAAALQKYGKALLAAVPVETTAALMQLCLRDPADAGAYVAPLADFTHLYTDRRAAL